MYTPSHFEIEDQQEIFAFIHANAFGQLISNVEGRLFCSLLPFLVGSDQQTLLVHMAKANPQWQTIENQEVLITFQGEHDYVSPTWYSGKAVPTWNYQAVHIYGQCRIISTIEQLSEIVGALSQKHESAMAEPWQAEYQQSLLDAIVGLEIQISDIQCKYKLSQNRSDSDRKQVAKEFDKRGSKRLSKAMRDEL